RTRALILEAAKELANSKGVGSVTMQMVAAKAKIAAGTAYQFFDDRDSIFFDLYETWAGAWWSSVVLSTSRPWTAATWADGLDAVVENGCKFHLKHKEMWEVIRYVESTKVGRDGMRLLFDANVDRVIQWASPYLKTTGMSPTEIRSLCASIIRTARGHHMYWPLDSSSLRETIRGSQEAQRAIVEAKLRTLGKKSGASGTASRAKSV
ncbi:MAG: TetR/AcrR family transcriptional regulator, partial [bacterium]|nr:TetR/AcrR family transcriptional regulator [Candidatus Aquidulcis frankliniae]